MNTNREYPIGLDCIWLAEDLRGRLAVFITAGVGPIPEAVFRCEGAQIEDLEELLIQTLGVCSSVDLQVEVPRPDDFIAIAQRGFFVFDWRDVHRIKASETGSYVRVASPLSPINRASISKKQLSQLRVVQVPEVGFEECPSIHFERLGKVVTASTPE
jgi:hypothetical protein